MNIQKFSDTIIEELALLIPTKKIEQTKVLKNNGIELIGITILQENSKVAPTIYINSFWETYLEGTSITSIAVQILNIYEKEKPKEMIDICFFTEYETARQQLVYKLVNLEKNQELLSQIPHIRFLDLAMVFYCIYPGSLLGQATILVKNNHLEMWGKQVMDIYNDAKENTPKLLKPSIKGMNAIIWSILQKEEDWMNQIEREEAEEFSMIKSSFVSELEESNKENMYVLSNETGIFGAICILYEELIEKFANQIESDLYILPSSVHEVILVPTKDTMESVKFEKMVAEVNETQVSPEEILSNKVYYFSRNTNKISFAM